MNEEFEDYIELRGFIEKRYDTLIKKTHGKTFSRVWREFSKKCQKEWKTWPQSLGGGIFSLRVYSTKGFEYVYLYAGLKDRIILFKSVGNEVLEFFRGYAKEFGKNYILIDLFLHVHKKHDTYLESVLYSHINSHRIVCSTCDKNLDLTDYENY
jgi:hypothetical protein